jgi:glycosidase
VIDKLDYLAELGITGLYLNPVFTSPSAHKYDGAGYHHVDPHFGPDPAGDKELAAQETLDDPLTWNWTAADRLLLKLVHECHVRGMRIILDGVFNHMGLESRAFQDVVRNGRTSGFAHWFKITSWDRPTGHAPFDYRGWAGVRELPELQQDAEGIVAGPREYIFACTRRWMAPDGAGWPADGIDGWRLDVACCIAHPFWKVWRRHVKAINPQAYITAELVDTPAEISPYLQGDEFDAVMNYNFAFACDEFFFSERNAISASEFDTALRVMRNVCRPAVAYVQQNLFGSHDTARVAAHIVNRDGLHYRGWDHYHPHSRAQAGYKTRKPTQKERQLQKLFVIFQMTYVGAPMIYYGDEAGMWGANDPCCRKPMIWDDMVYEDEIFQADGTCRDPGDTVEVDAELRAHYRVLIHLRNRYASLRRGDYQTVLLDDARKLFGFCRTLDSEMICVFLNADRDAHEVEPGLPGQWQDALNGGEYISLQRPFTVAAYQGRALVRQ